jgi:hypothetical protein
MSASTVSELIQSCHECAKLLVSYECPSLLIGPRKLLLLPDSTEELDEKLASFKHPFFKVGHELYYSYSTFDIHELAEDMKDLLGHDTFLVSEIYYAPCKSEITTISKLIDYHYASYQCFKSKKGPKKILLLPMSHSTEEVDQKLALNKHPFFKVGQEVYFSNSTSDLLMVIRDMKDMLGHDYFLITEIVL